MPKSGRGKSARKPLVEISNTNTRRKPSSKEPSAKKIPQAEEREERASKYDLKTSDGDADATLDRLLLAHSDLSNLIHQIDELVVQAFKVRLTWKIGSKEIESFMHVLSEMHSTLKPWVPRFQRAFSSSSAEFDNHLGQSFVTKIDSATNEERNNVSNYPEEPDLGSLISPSPLVSWRADCRVESGRQLFLLTPLPRLKASSSFKFPGQSKSILEKVPIMGTPCTLSLPPLSTISRDSHDDLLDKEEFKPTPKNISKSAVTMTERTSNCRFISPSKISNHKNRDCSMYLMTPLMKTSPPKTCMFLEPVSESFQQNKNDVIKPSPLAGGVQDCKVSPSSEKSSNHVSECLASKYPELFGIHLTHKSSIRRRAVEASLDWFFSPPKTCVLMEPPDEKLPTNPVVSNLSSNKFVLNKQPANTVAAPDKTVFSRCQLTKESCNHGLFSASLAAPASTPIWKDFESTVHKGGKQPGENTLKRELWTKFQAVSTSNFSHFDASLLEESTKGNGFLDRLEEVSCEETGPESKALI